MYYDTEDKQFYEDGERPKTASARAKKPRRGLHFAVCWCLVVYGLPVVPDGLVLALPALYLTGLYYFGPARRWFTDRRALKRYQKDLYSQDPLAELERMR